MPARALRQKFRQRPGRLDVALADALPNCPDQRLFLDPSLAATNEQRLPHSRLKRTKPFDLRLNARLAAVGRAVVFAGSGEIARCPGVLHGENYRVGTKAGKGLRNFFRL